MTKDEFLDIMGGIDESIIDGTLDLPHMDTVVMPYKRPSVLKYILYAAACIALVFAVGSAVRYFNGREFLPNDAVSDSSDSTSIINIDNVSDSGETKNPFPDFIRSWNPENILPDAKPELGRSAVVSTAELDGISVSLILHNITKLPGEEYSAKGHDYTDYWGAEDIALYVKDKNGVKTLYEYVTDHYNENQKFIHGNCIFDGCTRLYETEYSFIIMQYADYDSDKDALIARYYNVYTYSPNIGMKKDQNNISNEGIYPIPIDGISRIGGWAYGYQASKSIYQDGALLVDPEYGYELNLNKYWLPVIYPDKMPEGYEEQDLFCLTGWDPESLEYDPHPAASESAVVSTAAVDDMTVSLIMYNVVKRPGERHYIYSGDEYLDMWIAGNIYLYIKDGDGRRLMTHLPTPLFTDAATLLPSACLFDGCTRLFRTEKDGEPHYILMQYYKLDDDSGEPQALFIDIDMEHYITDTSRDENGVYLGRSFRVFNVSLIGENESVTGIPVSESFAHKEGTTFVDPVYGYELTFDYNNFSGTAEPLKTDGYDPEELSYSDPKLGGSAVLSSASLDSIDVSLIAHDISHLPGGGVDGVNHWEYCRNSLCADSIALYVKDGEGRRILYPHVNSLSASSARVPDRIPEACLFDGCTRIYKVEQDGETYYLIMQYAEYDEDNGALTAAFHILDTSHYDEAPPKDRNGISGRGLRIFDVNDPESRRIGGWGQAYQASEDFAYKGGTTFVDPVYGYEITFDMKNVTAKVSYPNY